MERHSTLTSYHVMCCVASEKLSRHNSIVTTGQGGSHPCSQYRYGIHGLWGFLIWYFSTNPVANALPPKKGPLRIELAPVPTVSCPSPYRHVIKIINRGGHITKEAKK